MTDLPAQDGKKGSKAILIIVLVALVLGGVYFVPDSGNYFVDQSALQNADSLFFAFQSLMRGDVLSFIEFLVEGIPLIAIFMIVFGLTHFVLTTALKSVFPKKKYATILSVVIAVYAMINPTIYNYIINANAYAVGFLVFSVLVIMLWGFGSQGVKSSKESFAQAQKFQKQYDLSKQELRELRRRLKEN